jgi:hypothetical protein
VVSSLSPLARVTSWGKAKTKIKQNKANNMVPGFWQVVEVPYVADYANAPRGPSAKTSGELRARSHGSRNVFVRTARKSSCSRILSLLIRFASLRIPGDIPGRRASDYSIAHRIDRRSPAELKIPFPFCAIVSRRCRGQRSRGAGVGVE